MRTVGLFSGIGGFELGFEDVGATTLLLCERDPAATAVLRDRFPSAEIADDVRSLDGVPECDALLAGFPCQDLSQAGRTRGIAGRNSSLVSHVFRLLDGMQRPPRWVVLENVPFMLRLDRGAAMALLVRSFEERGYRWAYRVVDAQSFGLPQRRPRVLFVASKSEDPASALLAKDDGAPAAHALEPDVPCGFYWTEGRTGVGWAVDAVPPLKSGSTVGIPSPPAIWWPDTGRITTPTLEDAERLQGFSAGWTRAAAGDGARDHRWRLVGNAINVRVAQWLAGCLKSEGGGSYAQAGAAFSEHRWPDAAWGSQGRRWAASCSAWPVAASRCGLADFLSSEGRDLSVRAATGFYNRAREGGLAMSPRFLDHMAAHIARPAC